jgi:hypothetical protein
METKEHKMTLKKMLANLTANAVKAATAGDEARKDACMAVAGKVMELIAAQGNLNLKEAA